MAGKKQSTYEFMLKIGAKTDSSLKKACSETDKSLSRIGVAAKKVGKFVATIGAAAVIAVTSIGSAAVKSAAEYETQLANVSTLLTGTEAEIAARTSEIGQQIIDVSNRTGVATDNLTDGMYQVISAFGDSTDAAAILETAAKSAAAGNATTADSINLLSAVTKGYGDTSAEAVQKAADLAFATVRLGQTSFPELASSIGKVIPLTSTLGVAQEELFGAMATLTGVTGSTAEVSTQLKATMQAFLSPSANMSKALQTLGYESGQALLESEGLSGALQALKGAVNGDEIAFSELFSSVQAKTAVLAMAGNQAETLASKTAEMYKATGAANTAFERQTNTLAYDIQMIKNLGANFLTQLGTNTLPYVRELAEAALPVVSEALERIGGYVTGTIIPATEKAVKWISEHKNLIFALAAGITTAIAAYKAYKIAVAAYNAIMAIYQVVTAASATGTFTLAGAMTALNLPVLAVVAAIGLVVAAGILLYKNWDKVKVAAAQLGEKISQIWESISGAVRKAIDSIGAKFPLLGSYLNGWWDSICNAWENVKAIFSNIISFIDNVFSGNWAAAWENLKNIVKNNFFGILNLVAAPLNGIISMINGVLSKVNEISVDIPDWVPIFGGKSLGFSIPLIPEIQLPALASGGIATAATLAMVGEGDEPEAILPLSKLAALLDENSKPKSGGGGNGSDGERQIVFSPVFNFYGPATKEQAVEAGRISFAEFKRLYKQMKEEEARKSFSHV